MPVCLVIADYSEYKAQRICIAPLVLLQPIRRVGITWTGHMPTLIWVNIALDIACCLAAQAITWTSFD